MNLDAILPLLLLVLGLMLLLLTPTPRLDDSPRLFLVTRWLTILAIVGILVAIARMVWLLK